MLKKGFLIALCLFFPSSQIFAFDLKNGDIDIQADSLKILIDENRAEFIGNAVVKQGLLTVKADKLDLFFQKNQFERITFFQNIKVYMGGQVAQGDMAQYSKNDPIFRLTGNVRLIQNNNEIHGDLFTYNIKTQEAKIKTKKNAITPQKNRVKAKFNFSSKKDVGS
ncbi:LptA/OstA family protein [Candidatus Bandiella euplotis]|nr:LptA/OstA family protein [Candidatus Bandiella woodruffii]